jgi:hypothetical protein
MSLIICAAIAYVLCGVDDVQRALNAPVLDRPGWTRDFTISKLVLIVTTWPFRPKIVIDGKTGKPLLKARLDILSLIPWLIQSLTFWGLYLLIRAIIKWFWK